MSFLKPESLIFAFSLCIFSSKIKDYDVVIPIAVLIFLPTRMVFSQARQSAAARDPLKAGSFNFDPQLPRRFPSENWDQLFLSSYKACKLVPTAEGDKPTIRAYAEIGTINRDQLMSSSYKTCRLAITVEGQRLNDPGA